MNYKSLAAWTLFGFLTLEPWRYLDGQIHEAMAGILTVRGKEAKYEIITVE